MKKRQTLMLALLLASISTVFCQNSGDNSISGTMMAGTTVTMQSLPPGQKQDNFAETLYSASNHGTVEDGLINTNLLHCPKIRAVFQKVKNATRQSKCKVFHDLSVLLVRICPISIVKPREVTGKYTSHVRISKIVNSVDNVLQVDFTVTVTFSVRMAENRSSYTQCPLMKSQLRKKIKQAMSTRFINTAGVKGNTLRKENKSGDPIYHVTLSNQKDITVVYLKKPLFLKVHMKRDPAPYGTPPDCHSLKEGKHNEIIINKRKCVAKDFLHDSLNITKNLGTSINLFFQEFKERQLHSMLMYDKCATKVPLTEDVPQTKEHGRDPRFLQLLLASKVDIPRKVSLRQLDNGKIFSFDFDIDNTTKQRRQQQQTTTRQLIVFVKDSEELKTKNQKQDELVGVNDKSSTANKQVNKEKTNKVINQIKPRMCTKTGASITNKKEAIEWVLSNVSPSNHISATYKAVHPVPKRCTPNQVTCGILTFQFVQKNKLPFPLPGLNNQMMFLRSKKSLNENGEEDGEKDETERKLLNRELHLNKEEKLTYETLIQMNPEFEKEIRNAVADIRKSITLHFGADVWKSAVYTSELLIGRQLSCSRTSCTGSIKAILEYNLTRKAKPTGKLSTILHKQLASLLKQPRPNANRHRLNVLLILTGHIHKQQPMKKIKNIATKTKAPTEQIQANTDKAMFYKSLAKESPGHLGKKSDMLSKFSRVVNTRHFRLENGSLSKDEKIDLLMKILARRIKQFGRNSRINVARIPAGTGMYVLVAIANAFLIVLG